MEGHLTVARDFRICDCAQHIVTRIHDDARCASPGVERRNSLDRHIHDRDVECVEHVLHHASIVGSQEASVLNC